MWCLVFWKEPKVDPDRIFDGVVPKSWVNQKENVLYWPPKGMKHSIAIKNTPSVGWDEFPIVKVRVTADRSTCEEYRGFTTTTADSDREEGMIIFYDVV